MHQADKVRWGILGTGRITHQFVQDFAWVSNGEVAAVASRSQGSADRFAARYGIGVAYDDYRRLLDDPAVEAIYIATPHSMHFQNALDAISAGKHVLCEKPCTVTPEESRQLVKAAAGADVFLMEAMWTFFLPAIRKAREWVAQGRIGRLRQVKADFGYPMLPYDPNRREWDARLAGGCLLELGIYPVALAWLFVQREPVDIRVVAHHAPNGVEDDLSIVFDYGEDADGAMATLGASYRSKLQNWAYIIGEESYIAIPDFWRAGECYLYHLDNQVDHFHDGRESLGLNFEARAAAADILAGRQENKVMPWSNTVMFQDHMQRIRQAID